MEDFIELSYKGPKPKSLPAHKYFTVPKITLPTQPTIVESKSKCYVFVAVNGKWEFKEIETE